MRNRKHPVRLVRDESGERVERSKQLVLSATIQLLGEVGLGGVSVDEISKRSGVAKTTIYRHWPSRSALFLDACANLGTKLDAPDTGNLKDDLELVLTNMAANLRDSRWASVVPSIIDAAQRDPEIARLYAKLHEQFTTPLRSIIERGVRQGRLSDNFNSSDLVGTIVGALFYRRWFSREPLNTAFIDAVIEKIVIEKRKGR